MERKHVVLTIVCIIITSIVLRVWGINYDLPYIYHPDEPVSISISRNMFVTGDLNPHFFGYSSLPLYINALAYIPYYFLGKLLGVFQTPNDIQPLVSLTMGVTKAPFPTSVLLQRLVSVMFGIGTVVAVFFICQAITHKVSVGLLASWMMAISPSMVTHSRLVTPNIYVVFFMLLAFLASVLIYKQGKTWHYVAAGLCVGFAISSKYNGGLVLLTLVLAHFLRYGKEALKKKKFYLALFLCGAGFLLTTPFAIFDFSDFYKDFVYHAQYYRVASHPGMEGDALRWYLDYAWRTGGVLYIFAVLQILYGICVKSKEIVILSIFPVVYFGYISTLNVRNDRTFIPLVPFLFILAAWFLVCLWYKIKELPSKKLRNLSVIVFVCLTTVAFAFPLARTIMNTLRLTAINSRETARVWIESNLPPGSRIALESYAPFVEPELFSVHGVGRMIDYEPEWYIENGFDYLIFGQGMYGRFYLNSEKYHTEVMKYDNFFNRFTLVKAFTDGDYEVLVYKVK
ncbi:MAG: phospholipid carrier-dependent glycosyltransferase [Anaerolineae bacterium]